MGLKYIQIYMDHLDHYCHIIPQLDAHTPFIAIHNTTTLLFEYRRWLAVQACSRWILCRQNPTSSENNVSPMVRLVLKWHATLLGIANVKQFTLELEFTPNCMCVLFCVELLFIVHAKEVVLGFVFTIEQWWKCFACPSTQWCHTYSAYHQSTKWHKCAFDVLSLIQVLFSGIVSLTT